MSVFNPTLIEILDESVSQGRVLAVDFTGAGVTSSVSGTTATVIITSGAAGQNKESHIPFIELATEVAF